MEEAKKPQTRRGAATSDKQVGRAAVEGRKLAFHTDAFDLAGYVVGSDDFHWFVAAIHRDRGVYTALVHKTCPVVVFTPDMLSEESEVNRKAVEAIGEPFWAVCGKTYVGPSKKEQ